MFSPDRQNLTTPANFDPTVSISNDMTVLSTNPNELGQGPNLYDGLAERSAAIMAYDLAKHGDPSVSDSALLKLSTPPSSAAMVLGYDPHGTTYVVAMVCIKPFSSDIICFIIYRPIRLRLLVPVVRIPFLLL